MQDRIGENRHINLDPVIGNANPLEVNSEWAAKLRANSVFPTAVSSTVIAALVLASCVPAVEHASNPDEVNGGNENPERVEINDENAVAIFRDFDSFQYSGRTWSRAEGEPIELSRNRDDSLTRAHPVIKGEVRTGLDIVKGHTKQQAKEDGNGIITQERSFLAVESKDGKIYGYILLFDRDKSVINDDKATLKYRLGVLEEDGETLAEVQGGWYIEDIEKNEDGTTKLKKVRLEDPDLDLNVEIVEEVKQEGQPTPEATAPASFGYEGDFNNVIQIISGAGQVEAAEAEPTEIVVVTQSVVEPTQIIPQPPPTLIPTPESLVSPDLKPDFLWRGEPAPIGALSEKPEIWPSGATEDVKLSGVFTEFNQKEIMVDGEAHSVWIASFWLGKDDFGNDIIKEFFVGRPGKVDAYIVDISGKSIPGDTLSHGPVRASGSAFTPEELMDRIVLKEKVYIINLIVKLEDLVYPSNCEDLFRCSAYKLGKDLDSYNAQVYEELSGQQINQEDDNSATSPVGWILETFIFNDP